MPPGTDPIEPDPVLTNPQNWASRSHQELYESVHLDNDPGQAGEIGYEWGQYGAELTESARLLTSQIVASETKWTGDAADAARAALKKLADWVNETANTAVDVGIKVAEQGSIMATARAQMPEPVEFDWNQVAALSQPGTPSAVLGVTDMALANMRSREAHEQAISVMTAMETNSRQIDASMPAFKAPFNPVSGRVEEPVVATRMAAGAPTLGGAEALMPSAVKSVRPESTQTVGADTATPPPAVAGATPPPASAPSFDGGAYTPAAAAPLHGNGGGGYTPPPAPDRQEATVAASYAPQQPTYQPQVPTGGGTTYTGGTDYRPQVPTGIPNTAMPWPNTNTSQVPANPNVPKRTTPPTAGLSTGGGGVAAAARSGLGAGGVLGGTGVPGAGGSLPASGGGGAAAARSSLGAGGVLGGTGTGSPMQAGGSAALAAGQGTRSGAPVVTPVGAAAGGAPPGGSPMGGPAGGRGEEDKEHRSAAYVMGGDLFDVPGDNLPPAVLGDTKPKKQKGAES